MAKGYIFDKLLNRKIEGETNLTTLDEVKDAVEEGEIPSGTKLYSHTISLERNGGTYELYIASAIEKQSESMEDVTGLLANALYITDPDGFCLAYTYDNSSASEVIIRLGVTNSVYLDLSGVTFVEDSVTPL